MADKRRSSFDKGYELPSIDWDSILRDLFRYLWMILCAALAATLLAGAYRSLRYRPVYRSTVTFLIGRSGFSSEEVYDNLMQAETTTRQYSQIVSSSVLQSRVCEELGLPSFDASVSVRTVPSTNIMTLTVSSDTPRKAFLINKSVCENALDLMGYFKSGVTMMELEPAQIPRSPSNPLSTRRDMMLAALLGAAAMAALIGYISFRKDTIRMPEDIAKKVDTRLLGTIYFEKKHGGRRHFPFFRKKPSSALLISNPMQSFGFLEAYQMLATRMRLTLDHGKKKTLIVTSISENEGKSTVCANLALSLAQEGKTVILVDCDFRKPSLYRIFEKDVPAEEDLSIAIRDRKVPRPGHIASAGNLYTLFCKEPRSTPWDWKSLKYFSRILEKLREMADYILIDSSPMAFVSDSEEYMALSEACLLVIRQDLMEASHINDAVDNLSDTGTELIGCVLNGVRRGVVGRARTRSYYYGSAYGRYSHYRHGSAYSREAAQENRSREEDGA